MISRFRFATVATLAAVATLAGGVALAWEAPTTHAGLTERAALGSDLHTRLREQFGLEGGLFAPLTVPPADAAPLFALLDKLPPTGGYVPDSRGELRAIGWLAAGAVVADTPRRHAANHFFLPPTKSGLTSATVSGTDMVTHKVRAKTVGSSVQTSGVPAPAWIVSNDNPMSLAGFLAQYERAVRSRTPAERERALAGALLAAGAMMHVLQDMGVPSHVRNDLAAHLEPVGTGDADVGSRFERIAALAYGRLGIPTPDTSTPAPTSLQALFTELSGATFESYFSSHTLPEDVVVTRDSRGVDVAAEVRSSLAWPKPAPADLDLRSAREGGVELLSARGICLAHYQVEGGRLTWTIPDRCVLDQLSVILPEVVSYSTALLDYLFRGQLEVVVGEKDTAVKAAGETALGAGTLDIFWDDGRGVRQRFGQQKTAGGKPGAGIGRLAVPPDQAHRVTVLFRGVDAAGNPVVATGTVTVNE